MNAPWIQSIFHTPEEKRLRRHGSAGETSVPSLNDSLHVPNASLASADIYQGTDNRPDHIAEKAVGGNRELPIADVRRTKRSDAWSPACRVYLADICLGVGMQLGKR